jgi:3,2-trans-enoyl-CoA isomerase
MISKISCKSLIIGINRISKQANGTRILHSQLKRRRWYPTTTRSTTTTYHRQSFSTSPTSPPLATTSITSSSDFSDDDDDEDDDGGRIAIIRMNNKPVNALSMEMCKELSNAIKTVNEQQSTSDDAATPVSSVIISSSIPNIFSAGIDIKKELYQPNPKRLSEFWFSFQQLFLDIYGLPVTTISALNGHAPAGGCMISLACDYRIMINNPKLRIGYNESKLGITAPSYVYIFFTTKRYNDIWRTLSSLSSSFPHYLFFPHYFFFSHFVFSHSNCLTFYRWMSQQYIDAIGSHHKVELALLLGTLFTPQDALQIGLIDQLVDDDEVAAAANDGNNMNMNIVEMVAIQKAIEFNKIPLIARNNIKKLTRQPLLDQLNNNRQEDNDKFCDFVTSSKVQKFVENYLHSLAQKSKKSK